MYVSVGGRGLKLCLVKVFNRMIALEHIPPTLNEGLIISIYKGKGKDPFAPGSYRGITLSSVIIKLFEVMILHRLSPVLEATGVQYITQTAYQKVSPVSMPFLPHKRLYLCMQEMVGNPL